MVYVWREISWMRREKRREEQKRICYFRLFAFGLGYNTGFA
jgi:hypothetical protein